MDLKKVKNILDEHFHGKYEFGDFLSSGAFADLFLIRHVFLDDMRVMKLINKPLTSSTNLDLILREDRISCHLKHENIINIYDADIIKTSDDTEWVYFIMEYVPGGDLNQYLNAFIDVGLLIPSFWTITLIKQISYGLNILHSSNPGIVHGDLNPKNILLSFNSEDRAIVKISDFGVSKIVSTDYEKTAVGGTRPFMAPECFNDEIYPATDIYAAGVIFYLFLTNHYPYNVSDFDIVEISEGKPWMYELIPPSHYNKMVTPFLDDLVMKCLEYDYKKRYVDASELSDDIELCLEEIVENLEKEEFFSYNAIKKAFRMAKYEDKLDEAFELLGNSEMCEVLKKVLYPKDDAELTESKTITLKNLSTLTQSGIGQKPRDFSTRSDVTKII